MLGNFCYSNPTKLYFGDKSLDYLNDELKHYGKKVMLIYGGGSIKKNGMCTMEELVLNDDDEEIAYQKMKNKLEAMYGNNY